MRAKPFNKQDVIDILRSETFQQVISKMVPKQHKIFHFFRGAGFILAIIGGLAGYYMSWLSAQDSRKVEQAQTTINRHIEWLRTIDNSVMEMRKTVYLIKLDCTYGKYLTQYEQDKKRFFVRHNVVLSIAGVRYMLNEQVFYALKDLIRFDENIKDVCAKNAPPNEAWQQQLAIINKLINQIIREEQQQLFEISKRRNPFFLK